MDHNRIICPPQRWHQYTECHEELCQQRFHLIVVGGVGRQARHLGSVDDRAGVVVIIRCHMNRGFRG